MLRFLQSDAERELGDACPVLRMRIRTAKRSHREHVELTAWSLWGWPPSGRVEALARAARWYAFELGADDHIVDDFAAATWRLLCKREAELAQQFAPVEAELQRFRKQLDAPLPPPKLLAEDLEEKLAEKTIEAQAVLAEWTHELGDESTMLFDCRRRALGCQAFVDYCQTATKDAAELLAKPSPGLFSGLSGVDTLAERLAAAVRIWQLHGALEAASPASSGLAALVTRFSSDLQLAKRLVDLLQPSDIASGDDSEDGWHRPPGFSLVDQEPAVVQAEEGDPSFSKQQQQRQQQEETDQAESELAVLPKIGVKMRLHGVSLEDARCKSEILLLERLAGIVAEECGIPREWVSHMAVIDPAVA